MSRTHIVCTRSTRYGALLQAQSGENLYHFRGKIPAFRRVMLRGYQSWQVMKSKRLLSALFCVYLRLSVPLLAQNADLSGLVTDPSSLAVPNARMVVQSAGTGATRAVSSNQQGEYSVPALLPGSYNVTVEAKGFKAIHQNGVTVQK